MSAFNVCVSTGSGSGRSGLYSSSPDCQEDCVIIPEPTESICYQTLVNNLAKHKSTGAEYRDEPPLLLFLDTIPDYFSTEAGRLPDAHFSSFFSCIHYFQSQLWDFAGSQAGRCWHLSLCLPCRENRHISDASLGHILSTLPSNCFTVALMPLLAHCNTPTPLSTPPLSPSSSETSESSR